MNYGMPAAFSTPRRSVSCFRSVRIPRPPSQGRPPRPSKRTSEPDLSASANCPDPWAPLPVSAAVGVPGMTRNSSAVPKPCEYCAPRLNHLPAGPTNRVGTGRRIMQTKRHWLDYDPVALAVLVIGIGAIELLALSI